MHSSDHSRSGGNSTPVNTSRSEPVESLRSLIRSDLNELAKLKGTSTRSPLWWGDVLTLPGAWARCCGG